MKISSPRRAGFIVTISMEVWIGPLAQQALALSEREIEEGDAAILWDSSYCTLPGLEPVDHVSYLEVVVQINLAIKTGLSRDSVGGSEIQAWSNTPATASLGFSSHWMPASPRKM